jgi:uncharacterized protein (DUF362 family)
VSIGSSPQGNASASRVAAMIGVDHYRDADAVQRLVDDALLALGLPASFIRPGDRVVLKPNWIKEHDERHPAPGNWEHVITNPTVIAAVARWAARQLEGRGAIIICDAPQTDSSFATIRRYCGLDTLCATLQREFPGITVTLLDLRPEEWRAIDGVTVDKTTLPGDPLGHTHVRINEASEFFHFQGEGRLYGASYDMAETNTRHAGSRHEYLLCRTPMDADVLINIPKMKTHKKCGITVNLKGLVGINANKNWLPHHTEGTPDLGGDQFPVATSKARLEHGLMGVVKRSLKHRPRLSRLFVPLKKIGRAYFGDTHNVVRSGNWHGNDTCWRMVVDLNKCLFYFDGSGQRRREPLRYLVVVDGIVAGEGQGPMAPDPKPCGVVLAGTHPTAVDCVAASVMGFDWRRIRLLANSFRIRELNFVPFTADAIDVSSNKAEWNVRLPEMRDTFRFRPHFGWTGAIEARPERAAG